MAKTVNQKSVGKVRGLLDDGMRPKQINEITEIPISTIYRYKKEYEKELGHKIDPDQIRERQKKEQVQNPEPMVENLDIDEGPPKETPPEPSQIGKSGMTPPPDRGKGNQKKKEEKPGIEDDQILKAAEKKANTEITNTLSGQISRDYVQKLKSGSTLYALDQEYRESIEAMGYDWDEFLRYAVERLYAILVQDHIEQQNRITVEDVMSMKMAGKLEQGESDDMEEVTWSKE